jgi:hypothetical protein
MQRPSTAVEEDDERIRRNGGIDHPYSHANSPLASYETRSSSQSQSHSSFGGQPPFSPSKGMQPRRLSYSSNHNYTGAAPVTSNGPLPPHTATGSQGPPIIHPSGHYPPHDYTSAPRERTAGNYYDPTADSRESRSADPGRNNSLASTPRQVSNSTQHHTHVI